MSNHDDNTPNHDDPVHWMIGKAQEETLFRKELMSLVCESLRHSDTAKRMRAWINDHIPKSAHHCTREDCWRLIRRAAKNGWLKYDAPPEQTLQEKLAELYEWSPDRLTVVHTAVLDHVAKSAAEKLLKLVRDRYELTGNDPIRIGFAGGRSLRKVAFHLSRMLATGSDKNPKKIVFHAMVSAFGDNDFAADPNSFITYFVPGPLDVEIAFAPMPAPGIVESHLRDDLKKFRFIREAFDAVQKLHIIVTSGGRLDDEHSTLSEYIGQAYDPNERPKMREMLRGKGVIGDLLWQPLCADGILDMPSNGFFYCPNPLVDLSQLPSLIERDVRVLLVLGACGACQEPKGALLDAILRQSKREPLVTDVVTDSPNVFELLKMTRPDITPPALPKPR